MAESWRRPQADPRVVAGRRRGDGWRMWWGKTRNKRLIRDDNRYPAKQVAKVRGGELGIGISSELVKRSDFDNDEVIAWS
ncbi:hypothetical protein OsI_23584 [Oryza sativa Indica Group]|uniref:Uncharacterized protein n=1 Tax=Oryza sativa subsp. indica TaxID=39946 RepID=B8B4B5_ORYSI|nr:hypothetical protein OsI_23584 [Oryza sativa Indica Group]